MTFTAELRKLLAGATPADWIDSADGDNTLIYWPIPDSGGTALPIADVYSNMKDTDAALICLLRNHAAAILELVEAAGYAQEFLSASGRNMPALDNALARLNGEKT